MFRRKPRYTVQLFLSPIVGNSKLGNPVAYAPTTFASYRVAYKHSQILWRSFGPGLGMINVHITDTFTGRVERTTKDVR